MRIEINFKIRAIKFLGKTASLFIIRVFCEEKSIRANETISVVSDEVGERQAINLWLSKFPRLSKAFPEKQLSNLNFPQEITFRP